MSLAAKPRAAAPQPPQSAATQPPQSAATQQPQSAAPQQPQSAATQPPQSAATQPPQSAATQPPQSAATQPQSAATQPQSAATQPSQSAATQQPQSAATQKKELSQNGGAQSSTNFTEISTDNISTDEVNGLVCLDVTLPSGQRMDISVDYNTAMLDLLVVLAAKSKLNPTGLVLILEAEHTGQALRYKPNQTIGALGGRVVRIVKKDAVSGKSSARDTKIERPFEVTHRFTINFPRGQKTVVRISPLMTLAELLTTVCGDKGFDLDLSKYVLQIPGKPGVAVDLGATIQQVGVYEMNLVTVSVIPNRKHIVSTPDLSQSTVSSNRSLSTSSTAGDHQKKKGLLSFLGKKDKKHKSNIQHHMELDTSTSVQSNVPHPQATPPVSQNQEGCLENQLKRPQSLPAPSITSRDDNQSLQQDSQPTLAPARKKRRAPAPPAPTNTDNFESAPPTYSSTSLGNHVNISSESDVSGQETVHHKHVNISSESDVSGQETVHHNHVKISSEGDVSPQETEQTMRHKRHALTRQIASDKQLVFTSAGIAQQQVSLPNHVHSDNFSYSSGYHELNLRGCESPEATLNSETKYKSRIDATSIESSDKSNKDCAFHGSPIVQLQEKPEVRHDADLVAGYSDTLNFIKKRKAPAPPTAQTSPSFGPAELTTIFKDIKPSNSAVTKEPLTVSAHDTVTNIDNGSQDKLLDTGHALDSGELPERAVYNGTLQSIEFIFATQSNGEENDLGMMMMETASVVSENIEQVDISSHGNGPCSFIPPPPPLEPILREQVGKNLYSQTDDTCVEKRTVSSDDNTPASAVHSPVAMHARKYSHTSLASTDTVESISLEFQQAIQLGEEACSLSLNDMEASVGYKSEMALFVERMSKLAVENAEKAKCEQLDDSGSSLSLQCSDSNYDTESVIQHHHVDSSSEVDSLTRREAEKLQSIQLQANFNDCHENVQEQAVEPLVFCEEMEPAVSLCPPPQFDDRNESFINTGNHSSIDERSHSSIDERSHSFIDERSHSSIDERSHSFIDERSHSSIDERSHSFIDERSHSSIDERSHSFIDERSHSSIDERSHSPIDERSHSSIDERSHNSIDERRHSSIDERSHNSIDERSHCSIDERSHSPIDERSHSSIDERRHSSIDERSHNSIDERSHCSIDERSHSPIDERSHSSIDERRHSPIDERSHNSIDERSHSSIDEKRHSSINEKRHSPIDEKRHSPIDEKRHSSIDEKSHSSINEKRHSSIDEKRHSPIDEKRHSSIDEKSHSSINEKRHSSIDEKRHSSIKERNNIFIDERIHHSIDERSHNKVVSCERLPNIDSLGFTVGFTDPRNCSSSQLTQVSHCQPTVVEAQAHSTPAAKEEIILTTHDLSNVNFLPTKEYKKAKSIRIQPYVQTQPYVRLSETSLIMANHGHLAANSDRTVTSTAELVQARPSSSLLGHKAAVSEQSSDGLPFTKSFMHANLIHVVSNDDIIDDASNDPLLIKSRPRLLMNSSNNSSRKSTVDEIQRGSNGNGVANDRGISYQTGKPSSVAASQINQQRRLPKENEQRNMQRTSSTAVTIDSTAVVANPVADRVNHLASRTTDDKTSGKLLSKRHHLSNARSGSTSVAATQVLSSSPTLGQISTTDRSGGQISTSGRTEGQISTTGRTVSGAGKQNPKAILQVKLDPHEQLMTAIRVFKREKMKSVPIQTASNHSDSESQVAVQ